MVENVDLHDTMLKRERSHNLRQPSLTVDHDRSFVEHDRCPPTAPYLRDDPARIHCAAWVMCSACEDQRVVFI